MLFSRPLRPSPQMRPGRTKHHGHDHGHGCSSPGPLGYARYRLKSSSKEKNLKKNYERSLGTEVGPGPEPPNRPALTRNFGSEGAKPKLA